VPHPGEFAAENGLPGTTSAKMGWLTVEAATFRFTHGTPAAFQSSAPVTRTFCSDCGTPLTYRRKDRPLEVDVTLCTLDDAKAHAPVDHIYMADALPWDQPGDGLLRYAGTRTDRG
jgi:hypothetical protein